MMRLFKSSCVVELLEKGGDLDGQYGRTVFCLFSKMAKVLHRSQGFLRAFCVVFRGFSQVGVLVYAAYSRVSREMWILEMP